MRDQQVNAFIQLTMYEKGLRRSLSAMAVIFHNELRY